VRDLNDFRAEAVIAKGRVIAESGAWKEELPVYPYPAWAKNSVRLGRAVTAEDFKIGVAGQKSKVTANVIGIIENQAPTRHLKLEIPVENGEIHSSFSIHHSAFEYVKLAVIDRHHASGKISLALVSGFGFSEKCAVASTVSHDCHNLLVIGTDEACMAQAANRLAETGGGGGPRGPAAAHRRGRPGPVGRPAPLKPPGRDISPGFRLSLARAKNLQKIFNTLNGTHV